MTDKERRKIKRTVVFVNCSLSIYTATVVTLLALGKCV
jgi:hypothetical protein